MKELRIAFSSLFYFKSYTLINVLGLAVSLACVIIIFRYVYGELTVDDNMPDIDRTYIVVEEGGFASAGALSTPGMYSRAARAAYPTDNDLLKKQYSGLTSMASYPGFEKVVHLQILSFGITYEQNHYEARLLQAAGPFPDIFGIEMVAGVLGGSITEEGALPSFRAAVSDRFARKVFGDDDPMGKTILYSQNSMPITIIGIFRTPDNKITFPADIIFFSKEGSYSVPIVVLHPGVDYKKVNEEFRDYFENYYKDNPTFGNPTLQLIPLKELYFNKVYDSFLSGTVNTYGNLTSVILLLTVGILLLLVGVANFVNIYAMVAARRGRELGMKKVFGARGRDIFLQFWVENLLLVGLSLLIALAMIELTSPLVRNLLGLEQIPFIKFDYALAGIMLLVLPVVTCVFPFIRFRYSTPITSLQSVGTTGGRGRLRRVFLVFQYVLTLVMIMMSLYFLLQLNNMMTAKPGFETEDIIKVGPFPTIPHTSDLDEVIINTVESSPLFERYAIGSSPVNPIYYNMKYRLPGEDAITVKVVSVTSQWLKFFGISDHNDSPSVLGEDGFHNYDSQGIATEQFLRKFRITNWRDARLENEVTDKEGKHRSFGLDAVTGEFNGFHIGENFDPVLFVTTNVKMLQQEYLLLKIAPGKRREAMEWLEELHKSVLNAEFKYSFIEDEYAALYEEDKKVATIYGIFTVIAIIVSMLGLFSMSLFEVQQRYNEIAIRKVNGASTGDIIAMLLKKYIILLGIAFVISVPTAWVILTRYLESYAFRTPIHWWIFAAALLLTSAISLLTIIVQTKKAAETNPASVIRSE